MKSTFSPADLRHSAISVPPLCRRADGSLNQAENQRLLQHLENGGVKIHLYGGNANLFNIAPSEYPEFLDMLQAIAAEDSLMIPSVGPYYGVAMDQAAMLRGRGFATAMLLPATFPLKTSGVATALRRFAEKADLRVVVYIKNDGYLNVDDVASLVADGCVSWIKYAVVRPDERQDPFLRELITKVDPAMIVSGMGEQPTWAHLREFNLGGFTSGCVCVAPRLTTDLLEALHANDRAKCESILKTFLPLETLRNDHGPIPVLHEAVDAAGIAATGPLQPLLGELPTALRAEIASAAKALLS
jgi:dihydrodipicolinate synthase/N-acetylneuraminate lyase